MVPPIFSKNLLQSALSTIGLTGLALGLPTVQAVEPDPSVVFGNANGSNTQLGDLFLSNASLGNSALGGTITPGSSKYRFGAILFTATESGTFLYGQSLAPIDTVMMMYQGVFDPTTPQIGKLAGNDDRSIAISSGGTIPGHESALGTVYATTPGNVLCGNNSGLCPLVEVPVVAGQTYSLVVSHYNPGTYNNFQFPFTFYGTGNPVFYEYGSLQPITLMQPFFLASELNVTVEPLFIGGVLQMDQGNKTYTDDFRLTIVDSSTFDLNGNNITLSGVLKDNNSTQPGIIRFANGTVTLTGTNTYTGKTIVEADAILNVSADAQLGDTTAALMLEGGTVNVSESITTNRLLGAQPYTSIALNNNIAGRVSVAADKTFTVAGLDHTSEDLIKIGTGTLKILGGEDSEVTGTITVSEGTLESVGADALGAAPTIMIDSNGYFKIESITQSFVDINNQGKMYVSSVSNNNPSLNLTDEYQQGNTATLSIDLSENSASTPIITADSVQLAGTLNLEYFDGVYTALGIAESSSDIDSQPSIQHTIFSSNQTIQGDFSKVYLDGALVGVSGLEIFGLTTHDYLHFAWLTGKDATQKQYQVYGQQKLRWLSNDANYQGQFTLNAGETFTLDTTVLTDQAGTFSQWDGKTLVKKGVGTLAVTATQSYTGDTIVEQGTLAWGLLNPLLPTSPITQNLQGNYTTKAGATTALTETPSYLQIGGNFKVEGDACNGTVNGCFDDTDPLNQGGGNAQRGELKILPGAGNRPEIIVNGTADIRGAYLNVNGIRAENPTDIFRASDLVSGVQTEHVIIHAQEGFLGSDVWGGSNAAAGFANDAAPLAALDYLDGFASIVNCDPSLGMSNPCLYTDGLEGSKTQEYILSALELAWNYGGVSGINNDTTRAKNGNFTIQSGANFEVDVVLADQDQGTDVNPNNSSQLGFNSKFGWWDGKTLTKKGAGTLYLSGSNTYTGKTFIEQGVLSVADSSHLGNTQAIILGQKESAGKATLLFEKTPIGGLGNSLGLNIANAITVDKDIYLGERPDSTISVLDATHSVTITGNFASNVTPILSEDPLSGTSWVKAGAGSLTLAPSTGKSIMFTGDTWVQEGTLVLKGKVDQILGDIYNQGTLVFSTDTDTAFHGLVSQHSPTDPTDPAKGNTIKLGSATLLLTGNSSTDWEVNAGTLAVSNQDFNSDVTLAAGTTLKFDSLINPLSIGDGALSSDYQGKITADPNSTVLIDRADQVLNFEYLDGSTVGLLEIAAGRLNLKYSSMNAGTPMNARISIDRLKLQDAAEFAIYGARTAVDVAGSVEFANNSLVEITLDSSHANESKISADSFTIGNNVSLNILGFGTETDLAALKAGGGDIGTLIDGITKASQLASLDFLLLASAQPIVDEFANQPIGSLVNVPGYLVYQNRLETSTVSGNFHPYEYRLGNFQLAWTANSQEFTSGTFDLPSSTAFNVNVPLENQTPPSGGFDSNWDGTSLTKKGAGLLLLSSTDNTYTGKTEILGGELALAADNAIQNSAGVFIENNGMLTLVNNAQTIQQLQSTSSDSFIDLMSDGVLTVNNSHSGAQSVFAGNIVGGDGSGNTDSTLKLAQGSLLLSGQSVLDHLELAAGSTLTIGGDKSYLYTHDMQLNNAKVNLENTARLSGAIQDAQSNSVLSLSSGASWLMPSSSQIAQVNLDDASILFAEPGGIGNAGRRLSVDHWNSNNGRLQLVTDLDNNQKPRLDTLVVNQSGTGVTQVNIVDAGGFIPLVKERSKILPIESGNGVGVLPINAFKGGLTSGGAYYSLVYDSETGGFMIDLSSLGKTPEYQTDEAALEMIAKGSSLSALGKLSRLTATASDACEVSQAFGSIQGSHGRVSGGDQRSNDVNDYSLQLGSDLYAQPLEDACIRYGTITGYTQTNTTVHGSDPLKENAFARLGNVSTDSYYVGGYARYDHADAWYVQTSVVGFVDSIESHAYNTIVKNLDGQSFAASVELGMPIPLDETSSITPSTQLVYQTSSIDDAVNHYQQGVSFDRIDAAFARVGADYRYTIENNATLEVGAHLWHQFDTETGIHSAVGNSFTSQVGNRTWGDLSVGVAATLDKNWDANITFGYRGSFAEDNSITAKVGVQYKW